MSLSRPPHQLVATVIGAGTMGAQIAAHLANAGVRTHLLDIVPKDLPERAPSSKRNAIAIEAVKQLAKARPAPLMSAAFADRITPGNLDDDLEAAVAASDLVIEAVVERLDVKRPLFQRIAAAAPPHAVLATNTSGLPIGSVAEGLPEQARRRVVGMHFFNPPRYMHLLEIVSSQYTDPEVAAELSRFGEYELGKGIVPCPDTPNFIGNRIGIAETLFTIHTTFAGGYTIEEVDLLNGRLMGRPKTGSFRLGDLVGIDVITLVIENLHRATSADPSAPNYDESHHLMAMPPKIYAMLERGLRGDKVKQGFYKKTAERDASGRSVVLSLDLETLEYRGRREPLFPELEAVVGIRSLRARVHAALRVDGRAGEFLRRVYLPLFNYAAARLGEVGQGPKPIDDAMRWGYGWELGPFALWDAVGVPWGVKQLEAMGIAVAPAVRGLLAAQGDKATWYGGDLSNPTEWAPTKKAYEALPRRERTLVLAQRKEAGGRIAGNEAASLVDIGEGVACLEFHSKMNTLGEGVLQMLASALPTLQKSGGFRGLVIGNQGENFCAGADLAMILGAANEGRWREIDEVVALLQRTLVSLQYAEIPVIVAPHGLAIGGGCEVALQGAATVANAETYMGLVEIGVGLLPAGGGLKEIVRRASAWARRVPNGDPYPWVRRGFELVTTGAVSTSAFEARESGWLSPRDPIVFHRDHLIAQAKRQVIALADAGYVPPDPNETIDVIGASRGASFLMGAQMFVWGGYASEHDQHIAGKIAHVLSGGMQSGNNTPVTAQHLLDLEREAFVSLCGEPKTRARMDYMLRNKQPLRN